MKSTCILLFFIASFLPAMAQDPDTVKAGAYIISVHDINFHDKEYTIRFWLWFLYKNPEFDFKNQLDIPNAKEIDEPETLSDTVSGKTWVQMKMKCTMKENWVVHNFPFDKQHLHVRVENTVFDKNKLIFFVHIRIHLLIKLLLLKKVMALLQKILKKNRIFIIPRGGLILLANI